LENILTIVLVYTFTIVFYYITIYYLIRFVFHLKNQHFDIVYIYLISAKRDIMYRIQHLKKIYKYKIALYTALEKDL